MAHEGNYRTFFKPIQPLTLVKEAEIMEILLCPLISII